jgi:hypothetical protein
MPRRKPKMSTDYYMTCGKCMDALHVAQDGLGGFTFYRGDPDCMKALGSFLERHALCNSIMFLTEHVVDSADYKIRDSSGKPVPDPGDA